MNASPAGDTLPVLLALDAALVVGGPAGERTDPGRRVLARLPRDRPPDGELLLRVRIPIVEGRYQAFRKVGTRRAQAISKVVLALPGVAAATRRGATSGIAFGSVAATPIRAGADRGRPRGRAARRPRPSTARSRRLLAELAADRRRPLDRRLPPRGRRPGPAAHPGGRGLIELGANRYGKSAIRLVKVDKRSPTATSSAT